MNPVTLDALDAVELSEICELVDTWLAASPDATASYDRHIGQPGQAADLQVALRRHANTLMGRPVVEP